MLKGQHAKWRRSLLVATILSACLAFDAHSQQQGIGGAINQGGFNPAQMPMSPRAFSLSSDTMGDVSFNQCVAMAQAVASVPDTLDPSSITADNALTTATSALGGILGGALGAGVTKGNVGLGALNGATGNFCSATPTKPACDQTSCDSFKVNDSFDNTRIGTLIAQCNSAASQFSCRSKSLAATGKIVDCFQQNFQHVKDAMQEVKKDFDANIKGMNQYVQQIQGAVQAEEQKQETLAGKISTLQDTTDKITKVLAQITGGTSGGGGGSDSNTLAGLQQQINQQTDLINKFEVSKRENRASRVQSCIQGSGSTTSGIHTCPTASGDLLSPKDCVLSVFRDTIALGLSNGSRRVSQADQRKADFQKKVFENRLNQMLADFGGSGSVHSGDDFAAKYGAQLAQYGPAGNQLISEIKGCDSEVQSQINKELTEVGTELGSQAVALRNTSTTLSSNLGGMINQLDTAMRDAGKELFGGELNGAFNGNGCAQSSIQSNSGDTSISPTSLKNQLSCAKNISASLQAMLNGTSAPGSAAPVQVPLNVPGLNGAPARCQGLRDCLTIATQLKATSVQHEKDLKGDGTFQDPRCPGGCPGLSKFKKDASQQIQAALQQSADLFSARVAAAKAQFAQVKAMLGAANLQFPDASKSSQATGKSLDEVCPPAKGPDDPICTMPGDFGDKLAGLAGMPDVKPESFDSAKEKANAESQKAATDAQELRNNVQKLAGLQTKCVKDVNEKKLAKKIGSLREDLNAQLGRCKVAAGRMAQGDVDNISDKIQNLSTDLKSACSSASDSDDCKRLSSDISNASSDCQQVLSDTSEKKNQAYITCQNQAYAIATDKDGGKAQQAALANCGNRPGMGTSSLSVK